MITNGPKLEYDGLYGSSKCLECKWFGMSERIEHKTRCRVESNMVNHRLGTTYIETPDGKNHLGRCPDFEKL